MSYLSYKIGCFPGYLCCIHSPPTCHPVAVRLNFVHCVHAVYLAVALATLADSVTRWTVNIPIYLSIILLNKAFMAEAK